MLNLHIITIFKKNKTKSKIIKETIIRRRIRIRRIVWIRKKIGIWSGRGQPRMIGILILSKFNNNHYYNNIHNNNDNNNKINNCYI